MTPPQLEMFNFSFDETAAILERGYHAFSFAKFGHADAKAHWRCVNSLCSMARLAGYGPDIDVIRREVRFSVEGDRIAIPKRRK